MNKLLKWDDQYLTGIKEIDLQHKKIFNCLNDLNVALEQLAEKEKILKLINRLDFYTTTHFDTEESYMLKLEYEKYDEHKKIHEYFKEVYNKIKNNYLYKKNKSVYVLAVHLTCTLAEWLKYHFENEDKELAEFLKNKIKEDKQKCI